MGAELDAGGFGRGERAEKHDRERHRSTQVRGSRKEITPLLLLYWFIFGSMEYTIRLLPSYELLPLGVMNEQPTNVQQGANLPTLC
jgi:hypothetical protein